MQTKLQRIGDELALVFDPACAERLGLTEDTRVQLTVRDKKVHIVPVGDDDQPITDSQDKHPPDPAP